MTIVILSLRRVAKAMVSQALLAIGAKQLARSVVAVAIAALSGHPLNAQNAAPALLVNPNIEIKYLEPEPSQDIREEKLLKGAKTWLEERQVLERFGRLLTPLRLPQKLSLTAKTCHDPNAFFDRKELSIIICYEFIPNIILLALKQQDAPKEGKSQSVLKSADITKDDVEVGGLAFALLHEVGHMVFHYYNVPLFGRNEDAADQVAAFLALKFSPPLAQRLIKGGAGFLYGDGADLQSLAHFADEHGSPTQRLANVFCMAYGHSPEAYQYIIGPQLLSKARADGCAEEYRQVERAFAKTVEPHIDKDKVEALKAHHDALAAGFK